MAALARRSRAANTRACSAFASARAAERSVDQQDDLAADVTGLAEPVGLRDLVKRKRPAATRTTAAGTQSRSFDARRFHETFIE